MRTTVTLDDDLLARAEELTGVRERSALIRDAVELLVRIESGRQLAALGGSDSAAEAAPRITCGKLSRFWSICLSVIRCAYIRVSSLNSRWGISRIDRSS